MAITKHSHTDNIFVMICVEKVDVIGQPEDGKGDHYKSKHFHNLEYKKKPDKFGKKTGWIMNSWDSISSCGILLLGFLICFQS